MPKKTDKQRLEAIKKDLMERAKLMRESASSLIGIRPEGIAEIYDYILLQHFGEKCVNCGKKKVLVTKDGLCETCFNRWREGIG